MYSSTDIIARAWMVVEVINMILSPRKVDKVFLVGSYASGNATEWSDLDFVIQLDALPLTDEISRIQAKSHYPAWEKVKEIHSKLDTERIHVIFGTEESTKALYDKHKNDKKNYAYKEINLGGLNATTLTAKT